MNPRALLASPLGFLIGVSLGALGGGGSILAVPALVYVAGQDPRAATTTSLFVVGVAAVWGMVEHLRAGHVRVGAGLAFGLAGIGGSLLGSHLNRLVDGDVLLLAFSVLMVVAAWRMCARECRKFVEAEVHPDRADAIEPPARLADRSGTVTLTRPRTGVHPAVVVRVLVAGSVVGFMTGFFGVGGGFVIVPALVLALGFTMPDAVGTSLLVIAVNSAMALSTRLATTGVEWDVALPFTVAAVLGVTVGKRIADRVATRTLVKSFVVLMATVAAYTAARSVLALT